MPGTVSIMLNSIKEIIRQQRNIINDTWKEIHRLEKDHNTWQSRHRLVIQSEQYNKRKNPNIYQAASTTYNKGNLDYLDRIIAEEEKITSRIAYLKKAIEAMEANIRALEAQKTRILLTLKKALQQGGF
jgi:hypothetical protein